MDAAAIAAFGEAFKGEVVLPGSANYDASRLVWNGMIDRRPALIARCAGVDDVISTIRFARDQDLVTAVRCGGHSVGGPNFGVVTAFEFRLHELGETVTQGMLVFPAERAHELAARVREWAPSAPDDVMISFGFGLAPVEPPFPAELAGMPIVYMAATHSGSPDAAGEAVRSLRDLGPLVDTIAPPRYLDVQAMADEVMAMGQRL